MAATHRYLNNSRCKAKNHCRLVDANLSEWGSNSVACYFAKEGSKDIGCA